MIYTLDISTGALIGDNSNAYAYFKSWLSNVGNVQSVNVPFFSTHMYVVIDSNYQQDTVIAYVMSAAVDYGYDDAELISISSGNNAPTGSGSQLLDGAAQKVADTLGVAKDIVMYAAIALGAIALIYITSKRR